MSAWLRFTAHGVRPSRVSIRRDAVRIVAREAPSWLGDNKEAVYVAEGAAWGYHIATGVDAVTVENDISAWLAADDPGDLIYPAPGTP